MTVETSRHGRVLVITMKREEKRNALNDAITAGIDAAMNELEDDPELWCGILTGASRSSRPAPTSPTAPVRRPSAAAGSGSSAAGGRSR